MRDSLSQVCTYVDEVPHNPAPRKRKRWEKAFLAALAEGWSVTRASKIAEIDRSMPYLLRSECPDFGAEWERALEQGADGLEDEARKRAFDGSDTMLIFLLKGVRPDKFRERVEHKHTGTVQVEVTECVVRTREEAKTALSALAEAGRVP